MKLFSSLSSSAVLAASLAFSLSSATKLQAEESSSWSCAAYCHVVKDYDTKDSKVISSSGITAQDAFDNLRNKCAGRLLIGDKFQLQSGLDIYYPVHTIREACVKD